MIRHIIQSAILIISAMLILCGCGIDPNPTLDADNVYTTDTPVDPLNYTSYVNKEIDLAINIMTTHISVGHNIASGISIIDDELQNLKSDLDMMSEAIESVNTLYPPAKYEDDRIATLKKLQDANDALVIYRSVLIATPDDTEKIQQAIDLMETYTIALKSSFNVMTE